MAKDLEKHNRPGHDVLDDINPAPGTRDHMTSPSRGAGGFETDEQGDEDEESMTGGSQHDRTSHAGSRDVTEGTTGGTGAETGGTRNYRQGTGASGGDIGNRPE